MEYSGDVFSAMSMEGRMTVCNMSIEMGARGGMIAPDEKTFVFKKTGSSRLKINNGTLQLNIGRNCIQKRRPI